MSKDVIKLEMTEDCGQTVPNRRPKKRSDIVTDSNNPKENQDPLPQKKEKKKKK